MCMCVSVCVSTCVSCILISTCVSCILISQISEYMNLSGRKHAGEEPETIFLFIAMIMVIVTVYHYDNLQVIHICK